jgi:hypothetical protein
LGGVIAERWSQIRGQKVSNLKEATSEAGDIGFYFSLLPVQEVLTAHLCCFTIFLKVKKKGDCYQHEPVPAAALVLAYILLIYMP